MNHCETCRHWADRSDTDFADYFAAGLRRCESPRISFGYAGENVPGDGAQVENDEGWGMATGPKFGCVLHEERQ